MTELTLQRLKASGWTPGRKVDISPIEKAYAEAGMVLPKKLREFFTEFGFLTIRYDIQHTELERHTLNPVSDFRNYSKEDFEHLFDDYEVFGMPIPLDSHIVAICLSIITKTEIFISLWNPIHYTAAAKRLIVY